MSDVQSAVCTFTFSVIRFWASTKAPDRESSSRELACFLSPITTCFFFGTRFHFGKDKNNLYIQLYVSLSFRRVSYDCYVTNIKVCFLFPDLLCFISLKSFEIRKKEISCALNQDEDEETYPSNLSSN